MSANLNSLSGIIYEDYIRPRNWFKHNDRNANLTMKIVIFATGTYCVLMGFIVEQFSYIFQVIRCNPFIAILMHLHFDLFQDGYELRQHITSNFHWRLWIGNALSVGE